MAEGLAKMILGEQIKIESAGLAPVLNGATHDAIAVLEVPHVLAERRRVFVLPKAERLVTPRPAGILPLSLRGQPVAVLCKITGDVVPAAAVTGRKPFPPAQPVAVVHGCIPADIDDGTIIPRAVLCHRIRGVSKR